MSEILACPNCEGPLTDSWLERAMDGSSGKRCESCTKAYHNPYGAAAEFPLRRRQLVEAGNELARVMGDLEKATTALEEAQAQIAALKIEVAGMTKERDEAERRSVALEEKLLIWGNERDKEWQRAEAERKNANEWLAQKHDAEKARDAALADLSQARAELEAKAEKHANMQQKLAARTGREIHELQTALQDERAAHAATRAELEKYRLVSDSDYVALRAERDALREEVARLKGFHDCPKDADCETQWEVEKLKAKLGRTVAALQECGATIYASTDSYKELWRRAEIARAAITNSAAAGEAYAAMLVLCKRADEWVANCEDHSSDQPLIDAVLAWRRLAAVDARRGGGPEEKWLPADTCDKCGGAAYHERGCPERDVALRPARRGGGEGGR